MSSIERNIAKIVYLDADGTEIPSGNAVLINGQYALTVKHCVEAIKDKQMFLYCYDVDDYKLRGAELVDCSDDGDGFALLKIEPGLVVEDVELISYKAAPFQNFVTFGFNRNQSARPIWRGLNNRTSSNFSLGDFTSDLIFKDDTKEKSFDGLSGSPILQNKDSNQIIGLISQQYKENGKVIYLYGISVASQSIFLSRLSNLRLMVGNIPEETIDKISGEGIFSCFKASNPYFYNYFKHEDRLFYPENAVKDCLIKVNSRAAVIIKGRQGSGKTTLALKLAKMYQEENPQYVIMYTNIATSWYHILSHIQCIRNSVPDARFVWVIDDIHKSVEFETEIVNWPFSSIDKYIFATRNSDKTKGNPYRAESSRWDDECVIKLDIDNLTFSKYLYADPRYVELPYRDVEKIFSMCGGDLTLLENFKVLYEKNISAHFGNEQDILRDIFSFYFPNSRYAVQANEFKDALKMLVMGMLDFPIPPSLQNRTCNTILAQFFYSNIKGELEFDHASIAELIFSCITNYLQLDFKLEYESLVREISQELVSPNTRKDEIAKRINTFLQSMLTYKFVLPINKNKAVSLNDDAGNDDTVFILRTHNEYISSSTWKLLVNDKFHRDQNINLFISSINSNGFINAVLNSRDYNFRFIYRVLPKREVDIINDGILRNMREVAEQMDNSSVFVLLIRSLKDDTAIKLLEKLDQETILRAISNNSDGYFGFSCGLHYFNSSVNKKLEERIGEENLEKIISISSMSAILQFLEYFTLHRDYIFELIRKNREIILENQITRGYSVRRANEILNTIKRVSPDLLVEIENAFGEDFYISLLERKGNIQDLYDMLVSCSFLLRKRILDYLQEDRNRTIELLNRVVLNTRSIGTLNLSLKSLMTESKDNFECLDRIIDSSMFVYLIAYKGNAMDLLRIISRTTNNTANAILDAFVQDGNTFSKIIRRTIENRISIGTMGLVLHSFQDDLLDKIEKLFTANTYMELCRGNGNLPILMGIMQHSSSKMQIELAVMLKQNPRYKDELLNNTIEDQKKIGTFALCLRSLKDENEKCHSIFEEAIGVSGFMRLIGKRGNIVILSRFLQYMSDGMRIQFIEKLKKNPMSCDAIFDNTFIEETAVGNFHFSLRDMDKQSKEILNEFEHVLGAPRYLRIISELGNLTVLFQILQYSTPEFMEEIAMEFESDKIACERMIDRTIARRASIRAIPLPLKEINRKNPRMMELMDRIISAESWINLFVKLGDIMTVFGCISEMSDGMRESIINKLKNRQDDFSKIVSNTIENNISIGTLPLRIRSINGCVPNITGKFEALFSPEVFVSLMINQGKLSTWFLSLGELSVEYICSIQSMELYPIINRLFERSLIEKDGLFNVHYGVRSLAVKNYVLLNMIEGCIGRKRYKQLFIHVSSLFNVLRIASYSTIGMELCEDIIQDQDYFDALIKNTSGDELSNGFELDMYSAIMKRNSNLEFILNNLISDELWISYFEEKCSFHVFLCIIRWLQGEKIGRIADILVSNEGHTHFFQKKWRDEIIIEDWNSKFSADALDVLRRYGKSLAELIKDIVTQSQVNGAASLQ